jgi:hypothetical protein
MKKFCFTRCLVNIKNRYISTTNKNLNSYNDIESKRKDEKNNKKENKKDEKVFSDSSTVNMAGLVKSGPKYDHKENKENIKNDSNPQDLESDWKKLDKGEENNILHEKVFCSYKIDDYDENDRPKMDIGKVGGGDVPSGLDSRNSTSTGYNSSTSTIKKDPLSKKEPDIGKAGSDFKNVKFK